jgi:ribonuclease BN (tRNA processing enzyme)
MWKIRCNGCDSSGNAWYFANDNHKWGIDAGVCYDHADKPEYVFITHKHTDHWDLTAVNYLKKHNIKIVQDELDTYPEWAKSLTIPHHNYNWQTKECSRIATRMWKVDKLCYITDCQTNTNIKWEELSECDVAIVECNHRSNEKGLAHKPTALQHMNTDDCERFITYNLRLDCLIILSHVSHDNLSQDDKDAVLDHLSFLGYTHVIWAKAGQLIYWDEVNKTIVLK